MESTKTMRQLKPKGGSPCRVSFFLKYPQARSFLRKRKGSVMDIKEKAIHVRRLLLFPNEKNMCELQQIVGFQQNIKGGIVFYRKSALFYIAGQIGIFHCLNSNTQKFLPMLESNDYTAMCLGIKNLLALATKGEVPKIMLYNLKQSQKYTLPNPDGIGSKEYVCISFSENNEYLAAQGDSPSWPFVMWDLEKRSVLTSFIPFRTELGAKVFKFAFNPEDCTIVVALGRYFLRMYFIRSGNRFREEAFHEQERSQKIFHSLAWIQKSDKFAVGTSEGMLLVFQRRQLLQQMFLTKKIAEVPRIFNKIDNQEDKNIACLLSTKDGIICSYGGNSAICLHRKVDGNDLAVVASINIPMQSKAIDSESRIVQLTLNDNEDTLAASTNDGQILVFSFTVPSLLRSIGYEADFKVLLDQQHERRVICADTAVNRAIYVSCSLTTVIVWDYLKRKLLLQKHLDGEIQSVSIHPLGINLLVGFTKGAKVYNILYDKIEEVRQLTTEISQVSFAKGGHMMAISEGSRILLYSSLNFEKYAEFIGHEGEVNVIMWKNSDNRLLSMDALGKICEWDIHNNKSVWIYSEPNLLFSIFAVFEEDLYAATLDSKILYFSKYLKTAEIETGVNVTFLLVTKNMVLAGTDNGSIVSYGLPFTGNSLFEVCCHKGSIINMTLKEGGSLLLVTGEDGVISMWRMNGEIETPIPLFDEVLINRKIHEKKVNSIIDLERQLQEQTNRAESKSGHQFQLQEDEKAELQRQYEDIQSQLQQKIIALCEEKNNIQVDTEKTHLKNAAELTKERDENFIDFQTKCANEEENFKKLTETRNKKIESYESQIFNLKEEIKNSNESIREVRLKSEERLKVFEQLLQKELEKRREVEEKNKEFYSKITRESEDLTKQTELKFASNLQNARHENERMTADVDRMKAELNYDKEYCHVLDSEFMKKKQMYEALKEIIMHIKNRIRHVNSEMGRKEAGQIDKVSIIKALEEDAKEMEHLNSEANLKLQESKKILEDKSKELSELSTEMKELENTQRNLTKKLEDQQRELEMLNGRLKSTEKSIGHSTEKLLKTQLLLERYRKEFIDATRDIDNVTALRWALLQLFDKRVLRSRIKEEEVFVGDTDPYTKFCRQRDHYETLINTVLNRKQEIQSAFRTTYINLAKENSDWMAFAEDLRTNLKQKQERIRTLEAVVGLPASDFYKDPAETQRRFNKVYKSLKQLQQQENGEIQKRMDLVEMQERELQRLHGLIVVEEKGKVARKLGH